MIQLESYIISKLEVWGKKNKGWFVFMIVEESFEIGFQMKYQNTSIASNLSSILYANVNNKFLPLRIFLESVSSQTPPIYYTKSSFSLVKE